MPAKLALHDLFARPFVRRLPRLLAHLRRVATHAFAHRVALAAWILFALASSLGSVSAGAQTASIQTLGPSTVDSYSGVISASDGNFYAVTADEEYTGFSPADFGCPDQSGNDCTFIDKITPSGTVTPLHTFETDGFGNNGGAPNTDGFGPTPLVEGPDGYLYGSTASGGSAGFGTIFKISTSGVFTLLFTFPNTGSALDPSAPDGAYPSRLIFGKDGNLYGTSQELTGGYYLFQVTPSGSITIIATSIVAGDPAPQSIVQGSDGSFYAVNGIAFEQITLSGFVNQLHGFVVNQSQTMQPIGTLVEGPDQKFYGADDMSGSIFQVSSTGDLNLIYTLQPTDGQLLNPELALGSDGNFYGTTYIGGITTPCPSMTQAGTGIGCGTVFQVAPAGKFTTLYSFLGTSVDGAQPDGWLLQGSAGSLYGTFFNPSPTEYNNMFDLSLTPALPQPIQITFAPQNPEPNNPLMVNWSVLNAFSATMQQCHGSLSGGPSNGVVWLGSLTGSVKGNLYSGTYTFTPAAASSYTFTLNCGGIETGSATVVVGNGVNILTASPLPAGTVSKSYSSYIQAIGGTIPYTWGIAKDTSLPAGLTSGADSAGTLYITGTPTQFGTYTFDIGVLDSSTPQQATTKTFQLAIASGLRLAPSLNNGQIGTAYNQTASASGGIGPYKWMLASGKLPNGLTLNINNGTVSGTPTVLGDFKFSITVTDNEKIPATFTQAYAISTIVQPLVITPGEFEDCTVNVECDGQFDATGGKPPYTWAVYPGDAFPRGLTLAPNGTFSGTPTQYSTGGSDYPDRLNVQVTDSETPPVTVDGVNTINIVSGLKIVSIDLPVATVGIGYQAPAPVATGGLPPYKWTIASPAAPQLVDEYGATPAGVLYSKETPVSVGTFILDYTVSDSEVTPATLSQDATLTVVQPSVTSTTVLTSSNIVAGTGMSVTLTAKVTATGAVPAGNITFYNGSTSLGSAALDAKGSASITTTFSMPGVYTLTAQYSGGGAVTGSVSAPLTENVVTPTITATISPGTLTVATGSSGTLTLTLTPVGGYTGTVGLSCGTLPAHISCTFAPPSLTFAAGSGPVTDTLTINTAASTSVAALAGRNPGQPANQTALATVFGLPGLFGTVIFFAGNRRKRTLLRRMLLITIAVIGLAGAASVIGCGAVSMNAKPGTYTIPITLQLSGGPTQNVSVSVIVQ